MVFMVKLPLIHTYNLKLRSRPIFELGCGSKLLTNTYMCLTTEIMQSVSTCPDIQQWLSAPPSPHLAKIDMI